MDYLVSSSASCVILPYALTQLPGTVITVAMPDGTMTHIGDVSLDGSPICEVKTHVSVTTPDEPCRREAEWIATILCCGRVTLLCCQFHRGDSWIPWRCCKCRAWIPDGDIRWVKL